MTLAVALVFVSLAGPLAASSPASHSDRQQSTPAPAVTGVVHDASGGAIAGATVVARVGGIDVRAVTGADGHFSLTVPAGVVDLTIRANGFADKHVSLAAGDARQNLEVALGPASVSETVTVTPARGEQRLADTPASVTVVRQDTIRQSAAVTADDMLRELPTFSLFRRTSSLASHPTTQGVSLRGVGPSGVSRTLVLLDGVPFNDPFGGWVYWSRVPMEDTDRIEIVDNSSSSLYGNYAMGGVINIVTEPATRRTLEVKALYGSRSSPQIAARASDVWGKTSVTFSASAFDTDGYPPVAAGERGKVDNNADATYHDLNLKVEYAASSAVKLSFRAGSFREERNNGKASTIDGTEEANDTRWNTVSGGVDWRLPDQSRLQATLFGDIETFRSNFLAVPTATPPRSVGRMTLNQRVPTDGFGGMVQWSRAAGRRQVFTAGTDWRWVDGDSEEDGLDAATGTQVVLKRVSGGTQRSLGAFVQDVILPTPQLNITLSARVDNWHNYDGHNLESNYPSGTPTINNAPTLPERSDTVGSPRVAALYHLTDRARIWGDFGTGFRAPTLNELYRQFRVGTTLTLANNQLGPEHLKGGEFGIVVEPVRRLTSRLTWYDNRVRDPISNVTTATSGANVTQQRQNLGHTQIHGLQLDAEYLLGAHWRVAGGYLYNLATVTEYTANPTLVGKYLPQVPKHRGSLQVAYANPKYVTVSVALQAVGNQYDDDLNSRIVPGYSDPGLPKYALFDISASRVLAHGFDVFVAAQNLFNQTYYVGTLPTTVGSPRFVSGGVRIRVGGK